MLLFYSGANNQRLALMESIGFTRSDQSAGTRPTAFVNGTFLEIRGLGE
jgi:hypothetical protein